MHHVIHETHILDHTNMPVLTSLTTRTSFGLFLARINKTCRIAATTVELGFPRIQRARHRETGSRPEPAQPAVKEKPSTTAPAHSEAHSRLARVPMMNRSLLAVSGVRSSG